MPVGVRTAAKFERMRRVVLEHAKLTQHGIYIPALQKAGESLLEYMQREYKGLSRRVWPKITWMTYVLSKSRVKRPLKSTGAPVKKGPGAARTFNQITSRARRSLPLMDRGKTFQSLSVGRTHNLFHVTNTAVTVGSSSPILVKHQTSHKVRFLFNAEMRRRLRRNVPPKIGSRSNSLHYMIRAILTKRSGQSATVPARPLPVTVPPRIMRVFQSDVRAILIRSLSRMFKGT